MTLDSDVFGKQARRPCVRRWLDMNAGVTSHFLGRHAPPDELSTSEIEHDPLQEMQDSAETPR